MTSLNDIYIQYSEDVYRFSLGLYGDPMWAEDITSEAFVRAFVSPSPIRVATARAYLLTIARNLYLRTWHKERRNSPLEENYRFTKLGPETVAENREKLNIILMALQELPEIDRSALLIRAQENLSFRDIAISLGISLSAVKVKIHRARIKLAKIFEESNL
jgi:RNA polymerase sigma-70 factor, ECF subfamily